MQSWFSFIHFALEGYRVFCCHTNKPLTKLACDCGTLLGLVEQVEYRPFACFCKDCSLRSIRTSMVLTGAYVIAQVL